MLSADFLCFRRLHTRKHESRDHVASSVDLIGRLDEMFVAPTNRSVFTPGVESFIKKAWTRL